MLQDGDLTQEAGEKAKNLRLLFWLIFISAGLLFFWGIWSVPLLSHNEARRLVALREMIASHQWLTPMKNGVFYFEKPPLFYWSGVPFSLLSGSTAEWVLRLPSALAALFAACFLYQRVRTYIGLQPALFSALILVTSPLYGMAARRAEINVFFGMLCFTALLLYYDYLQRNKKAYLYLAFLVLGLASLAKGPVALVFFLTPLLVYALLRRDLTVLKGVVNPLGLLLFAVVGVSWFIYALYGVPDSPLQAVIQKDILGKVNDNVSRDPFYSYFGLLFVNFAPWTLILFYQPKRWLKRLAAAKELQFLVCAFAVPLIVMSSFSTHHGKYMLPLFPFVAAFLGCLVSDAYDIFGQRWGKRFHVMFLRLTGGLLAILFVVQVLAPPYVEKYRFDTLKPFAEKIRALKGESPVFSYKSEQIQLIYYYGEPIPVLDRGQLQEKLEMGQLFLLVVEGDVVGDILAEKDLCLLDEFAPYLKRDRKGLLYGSHDFCQTTQGTSSLQALPSPPPDE